jgi:ankyrin repeat protein
MLHVNSLKGKINAKAIEDALTEIRSGGNSLVGAYDKTMRMIESQIKGHRKLAMHTLAWVAFSSAPLTVEELQHALAIEPGKTNLNFDNITKLEIILSTCAGLINIQVNSWTSDTVHLVHETTQYYFLETREKHFGNVRTRLACLSLTYLTFQAFESGPSHQLASRKTQYPLYGYLGQYLFRYITCNREDSKVKAILEKLFLNDMCIHAYMQVVPEMSGHFAESTPLHLAIFYHISGLVPLLIHRYGHKRDGNGLTPLYFAVSVGFQEGIASLVSVPEIDTNAVSPWKQTALSNACETGDENAVRMLLSRDDIDCNLADEHGRTPLSYALKNGQVAITRLLLERSSTECVYPDHRGIFPLAYAALGGCEDCIKELLKRPEVDINTTIDDRITLLHWAVKKRNISTIEYVLAKPGIDVNVADHLGRTPLIWCIAHRSHQMTMMILSREDVKLNLVDKNGQGLLIWAAKWGWLYLIETLLDKLGDQLLAKDNDYRTALDHAAEHGNWETVEQFLKRYRTKIRIKHRLENTALFYAIRSGPSKMVSLLLSQVALEKNWWFIDALVHSMENDTLQAFEILTTKLGLWMRHNPQWIVPCLLRTAEKGYHDTLRIMVQKVQHGTAGMGKEVVQFLGDRTWEDIDIANIVFEIPAEQVDVRDRLGQTAIHTAAKRGDVATTRVLSMMGADVSIKDTFGRTPLMCALNEHGSFKAVSMVLDPSKYGDAQPRDGG